MIIVIQVIIIMMMIIFLFIFPIPEMKEVSFLRDINHELNELASI